MRRLFLLRHAKTETAAPSGRDRDRRLEGRGHTDAVLIGRWLRDNPPLPDLVMVSTAVRAQQTWSIVAPELAHGPAPAAVNLDELYAADPAHLLGIIHAAAVEDPRGLMIVGHNPGLHELALALVRSPGKASVLRDNLPTAALAVIDLPVDDWSDVSFRSGELVHYTSPKLLKAHSS